ncbi:MAG: PRC-barrel domain-containing protein [Phycisphaerales bacterium]
MDRSDRSHERGYADHDRDKQKKHHHASFHRATDLMGAPVSARGGETVAEVHDIIVRRGDGRVVYVVLEHGGLLGIGDDHVAVPARAMAFEPDSMGYRLDMDASVLEEMDEWDLTGWWPVSEDNWDEELARIESRSPMVTDRDPFRGMIDGADRMEFLGEVDRMSRKNMTGGGYVATMFVRTDDGTTEEVLLGPAWFAMARNATPHAGDRVEVTGYRSSRNGDRRIIAHRITAANRMLELRDDNRRALWLDGRDAPMSDTRNRRDAWDDGRSRDDRERNDRARDDRDRNDRARDDRERDARDADRHPTRLVAVSEMFGLPVRARDQRTGEIGDAVIDARNGRVAMLIVEMDDGVLDLDPQERLVPWHVVGVGQRFVTVDGIKAAFESGVEPPEDLNTLSRPDQMARVYRAFGATPRMFDGDNRWNGGDVSKSWSRDGDVSEALADATTRNWSGVVRDVRTVSGPMRGSHDIRAIKLDVDGSKHTVLLGPEPLVDELCERSSFVLGDGDRVTAQISKVNIDGQEWMVARRLVDGDESLVLWEGDRPVWRRR